MAVSLNNRVRKKYIGRKMMVLKLCSFQKRLSVKGKNIKDNVMIT
jgi:hypothetical protein